MELSWDWREGPWTSEGFCQGTVRARPHPMCTPSCAASGDVHFVANEVDHGGTWRWEPAQDHMAAILCLLGQQPSRRVQEHCRKGVGR